MDGQADRESNFAEAGVIRADFDNVWKPGVNQLHTRSISVPIRRRDVGEKKTLRTMFDACKPCTKVRSDRNGKHTRNSRAVYIGIEGLFDEREVLLAQALLNPLQLTEHHTALQCHVTRVQAVHRRNLKHTAKSDSASTITKGPE
jgi:hypothetical protein